MRSRYAGEIYLSFTRRGEQTVADRTFRRGNSRISANNAPGNETPYYFLISTGGGFTEGEQYLQDISLGESTHAILTTQAPGYIYKCENGRLTEQKFQIRIGDGACLEYYQDETIPYALARFRQRTEIELGRGSRLLLTDGLTAGWSADEQPFQYHDIGICTRVRRNGRLLLNDSLLVNPSADPMGEIGYFEGFTNYNSARLSFLMSRLSRRQSIRCGRASQTCPRSPCGDLRILTAEAHFSASWAEAFMRTAA